MTRRRGHRGGQIGCAFPMYHPRIYPPHDAQSVRDVEISGLEPGTWDRGHWGWLRTEACLLLSLLAFPSHRSAGLLALYARVASRLAGSVSCRVCGVAGRPRGSRHAQSLRFRIRTPFLEGITAEPVSDALMEGRGHHPNGGKRHDWAVLQATKRRWAHWRHCNSIPEISPRGGVCMTLINKRRAGGASLGGPGWRCRGGIRTDTAAPADRVPGRYAYSLDEAIAYFPPWANCSICSWSQGCGPGRNREDLPRLVMVVGDLLSHRFGYSPVFSSPGNSPERTSQPR